MVCGFTQIRNKQGFFSGFQALKNDLQWPHYYRAIRVLYIIGGGSNFNGGEGRTNLWTSPHGHYYNKEHR